MRTFPVIRICVKQLITMSKATFAHMNLNVVAPIHIRFFLLFYIIRLQHFRSAYVYVYAMKFQTKHICVISNRKRQTNE